MPSTYHTSPGVRVEEIPSGARSIEAVSTSKAAFIGYAPLADAHVNKAIAVNNWSQLVKEFVPVENPASTPLSNGVAGFFQNGGSRCYIVNIPKGDALAGTTKPKRTGLKLLEEIDDISIVAAPGYSDIYSHEALQTHVENNPFCFAILDLPPDVPDVDLLITVESATIPATSKRGADTDGRTA